MGDVVVDSHPYELLTKTCWEMDGAERLRWPGRLTDHRTKVNAVTRGQPGRNTSHFDDEIWLDLEDFFGEYNKMRPRRIQPPTVEELIALLYKDNKCRFEFKCIAGLQLATGKGLVFWPFKIRAVQEHSKKAVHKAAATDTFNAALVYYAGGGSMALSKVSLAGKPLANLDEIPGVIYHRTTRPTGKASWRMVSCLVGENAFQAVEPTATLQTKERRTTSTSRESALKGLLRSE